jgi:hypothetical protein
MKDNQISDKLLYLINEIIKDSKIESINLSCNFIFNKDNEITKIELLNESLINNEYLKEIDLSGMF